MNIDQGKTYWFRDAFGNVLERKVIAIDEPRKGMLIFKKPSGSTHQVSISVFAKFIKSNGITEQEAINPMKKSSGN